VASGRHVGASHPPHSLAAGTANTVCRRCSARRAPAAPSAAAKPAAPSQQGPLLDLTQWALGAGVKYAPGIRPSPSAPSGGRGITTAFPLAAGAALVSVPSKLALSSAAPAPAAVPAAVWERAGWPARLATLLLYERAAGADSGLAPFVASLPQTAEEVGLPAAWAPEELQQLQCAALAAQVGAQRREWEAQHALLAPHLPPALASQEAFFWSLSCVRSRSFAAPDLPYPLGRIATTAAAVQPAVAAAAIGAGPGLAGGLEAAVFAAAVAAALVSNRQVADSSKDRQVMCPLIDIFNHSSGTESSCELDTWSGDFKVVAREPVAARQEVLINYGAGGNDLLLSM
jgi:hypothetical protein